MRLVPLVLLFIVGCTQQQTITLTVIDPKTVHVEGCWNGGKLADFTGIVPEKVEFRGWRGQPAKDHILHCLEWVLQSLQPCE